VLKALSDLANEAPHDSLASRIATRISRAATVLIVGRIAGPLVERLYADGCAITGLVFDALAASQAGNRCSSIAFADPDVSSLPSALAGATFDAALFCGALELFREPASLLDDLKGYLRDGGLVVAIVPNVAHGAVRLALMQGATQGSYAGAASPEYLDELFASSGYRVETIHRVKQPVFEAGDGLPFVRRAEISETVAAEVETSAEADTAQFVAIASPAGRAASATPHPQSPIGVLDARIEKALSDYEIERFSTRYGTMVAFARDTVIARSLRTYGEWAENEINIITGSIVNGDGIVDIGANIGTHSVAFAKRFPDSPIFAIEPQPLPCAMLLANAFANDCRGIRVFNVGCSAKTEVVNVRFDYDALDGNAGAFSIGRFQVEAGSGGFPILLVPLDRLDIATSIRLIKIDVEGMESDVLAGAVQTLERHRPVVFFELLELTALNRSRAVLLDLSYHLYWLETQPFNADNYNGFPENIWDRCEVGILAVPAERRLQPDLPRVGDSTPIPAALRNGNPVARVPRARKPGPDSRSRSNA
jgi:FkbM family methyltransferase